MYLKSAICGTLCVMLSSPVKAEEWRILEGTNDLWVKINSKYESGFSDRNFSYTGLRFDRRNYIYEIVHLDEILRDSYPEITKDYVVFNEKTEGSKVVRPSMSEAWKYFEDDNTVAGLIPIGFSEVAGEPNIAGYRKREGEVENGIFSSPNLDTIFCLDDVNEHAKRAESGKPVYTGQIPFLFPVSFSSRVSYQYLDGLDSIEMGTIYDAERFKNTFDECRDMIQIGYRIIAPRDVAIDEDSTGRISNGPRSLKKLKAFDRVVMSYDRFGFLNFVRSNGPSHVHDFGLLLSSDEYYDAKQCKYRENPSYSRRSLSCELWAVTVSAFDGAAIYVRSNEPDQPMVWGDGERTTPAVLVIRDNSPSGSND